MYHLKKGFGGGSFCVHSLSKHILCRCFPGYWNCKGGGIVLYLSKCDNCVFQFVVSRGFMFLSRWSELTRKIELWVEIQELNEQGEYSPVEVITKPDILTGGIYQLRQGQQRRIQVRVKPVQNSGTLPIICQSIVSIAIGSVSMRWVGAVLWASGVVSVCYTVQLVDMFFRGSMVLRKFSTCLLNQGLYFISQL